MSQDYELQNASSAGEALDEPNSRRIVKRRPYGQWTSAALLTIAGLLVVRQFAAAEIDWSIIPEHLTSATILNGLWGTVLLTFLSMVLGVTIGTIVALMSVSDIAMARATAGFYLWFFRGIPVLVQLLIWFNISLVIPEVNLGPLYNGPTNDLVTPLLAALLGLGLAEGASMGEIIRSGILSVDRGQSEAAQALGFTKAETMRLVVLPQALPVIVPPTGNEVINMTKYTSLAFAVSYSELLSSASGIYSMNFKVVELLFTITVWYLVLTTVLMYVQARVERRFAKRSTRTRLTVGQRRRMRKAVV